MTELHAYPDVFDDSGYTPLFDGLSLDGWRSIPRVYGATHPGGPQVADLFDAGGSPLPSDVRDHPARWTVEAGILTGTQGKPGYGGYLITERVFAEFDLAMDIRPDWPADTGVMLRRRRDDWSGFQVLIDHRTSGSIGGFFGNGLASFAAVPFAVSANVDDRGQPVGLRADDPLTSREPVTREKIDLLSHAAHVDDFLRVWRWDDWNELRVRCIGGALPQLTTWINGVQIASLDTAKIDVADYDPAEIARTLGRTGHIALEVHDSDDKWGQERWGPGAACRWKNIRVRAYPDDISR